MGLHAWPDHERARPAKREAARKWSPLAQPQRGGHGSDGVRQRARARLIGRVTEGRAVRGEADGIGPASVQGRRIARDERGMVGEPSVHVSYPLNSERVVGQGRLERGQPGI
jgi:hypothetical protein